MKCNFIHEYLTFHPFVEKDPDLEEHLLKCGSCAAYHARFIRIMDQLSVEAKSNENPFLRAKILDSLQNNGQVKQKPIELWPVMRYAVQGLVVLAFVASGILLGLMYTGRDSSGSFASEEEKYRYYSELFYLDEFFIENIETTILDNTDK